MTVQISPPNWLICAPNASGALGVAHRRRATASRRSEMGQGCQRQSSSERGKFSDVDFLSNVRQLSVHLLWAAASQKASSLTFSGYVTLYCVLKHPLEETKWRRLVYYGGIFHTVQRCWYWLGLGFHSEGNGVGGFPWAAKQALLLFRLFSYRARWQSRHLCSVSWWNDLKLFFPFIFKIFLMKSSALDPVCPETVGCKCKPHFFFVCSCKSSRASETDLRLLFLILVSFRAQLISVIRYILMLLKSHFLAH